MFSCLWFYPRLILLRRSNKTERGKGRGSYRGDLIKLCLHNRAESAGKWKPDEEEKVDVNSSRILSEPRNVKNVTSSHDWKPPNVELMSWSRLRLFFCWVIICSAASHKDKRWGRSQSFRLTSVWADVGFLTWEMKAVTCFFNHIKIWV